MFEATGSASATSTGKMVEFGFSPLNVIISLTSGGPAYFSFTSSSGTTGGFKLLSTDDDAVQIAAQTRVKIPNTSSSHGCWSSELSDYMGVCTTALMSTGFRYWVMGA
jgi:hypothetical protein